MTTTEGYYIGKEIKKESLILVGKQQSQLTKNCEITQLSPDNSLELSIGDMVLVGNKNTLLEDGSLCIHENNILAVL